VRRSGGQAVVAGLERHGVDLAFCVPGESYLAVLDALYDSPIRLITCRHEAGAANMAEAYGKLTGRPGICLVTRGPGATHASVGVHNAWQDSTPMILLVGQVPRRLLGRDAFQEMDLGAVFGTTAKWVARPGSAAEVPEVMARAFFEALRARPGPVVVGLPEDVLDEATGAADLGPLEVPSPVPAEAELVWLRDLLAVAERPLVIAGEGGWSEVVSRDLLAFCKANELPVAASFRCQDYVDNRSRFYAGHLTIGADPKLLERVKDADFVLAVGRLGDIATRGFTLLEAPVPHQTLVYVHPDDEELRRIYEPELAIASTLPAMAAALSDLRPVDPSAWLDWTAAARADYLANLRHRPPSGNGVDLGETMAFLRKRLPKDAILASGAGNFTTWAHRFYEFSRYGTQLAPQSGAMGYGVPAAIAAKAVCPDRLAVCIAGDGDFLMSGQELATAVQYGFPIVVLVVNNGMYGTIRMHQERLFPGRVVGTDLVNPDFVAYAESFGAYVERVGENDGVPSAFERAVESGRTAVLELRVDPEAISPRATIAELREAAS
jgi:acetolactate synthase I/II/III large subunit